jgi:hypothetical protein
MHFGTICKLAPAWDFIIEGNVEVKTEIAIKLLSAGSMSIQEISEMTDVSIEELQKLKQQHPPTK